MNDSPTHGGQGEMNYKAWEDKTWTERFDMTPESAEGLLDEIARGIFTGYQTSKVAFTREMQGQVIAAATLVLLETKSLPSPTEKPEKGGPK